MEKMYFYSFLAFGAYCVGLVMVSAINFTYGF